MLGVEALADAWDALANLLADFCSTALLTEVRTRAANIAERAAFFSERPIASRAREPACDDDFVGLSPKGLLQVAVIRVIKLGRSLHSDGCRIADLD